MLNGLFASYYFSFYFMGKGFVCCDSSRNQPDGCTL